jgi:2-phosphoglycerate kinase
MNIKVEKRDGKIEEYEDRKIGRVVIACGLDSNEAEKFVMEVNNWITAFDGKTVTSGQIRDKILEILPKYSDYSAKQYSWWEKYKDKYNLN